MKRIHSRPSRFYWAARTAAFVAAEHRVPFLPTEKLENIQNSRVRSIVKHAYRTVPYYRQVMHDKGLHPGDFRTAADLARLPVIGSAELSADPRRFLSLDYPDNKTLEMMTSGSTGHAKQIFWDKSAIFRAHAAGLRHRDVLAAFTGRRSGYRQVIVRRAGGTGQEVRAFHQQHSWVPAMADPSNVNISPREPFEQAVQRINEANPDVIRGFGGYIGAIYRWAWTGGHEIAHPKVICYGGEHMHLHDRQLLESEFRIPVITSYQACEAMRIAFQCPRAEGLHISVDQTDVRIADDQGKTLPPGQSGRVMISNLTNRATVLLNYDLGDLGVMSGSPCGCGRTLPVLERLDGRADDFVMLPGGEAAHDSVVLSSLFSVPGVMRLQIVQDRIDSLDISVICEPENGWDGMQSALNDALCRALECDTFKVKWRRVDELEPGAGGKFRSIICRVPGAHPAGGR